jgi:hypothetical protein
MGRPPALQALRVPLNIVSGQQSHQSLPHSGRRNLHFRPEFRDAHRTVAAQEVEQRFV